MFRLATSPIAPLMGFRRRPYLRLRRAGRDGEPVLVTAAGDLFQAEPGSFRPGSGPAATGPQVARLLGHLVRPGDRCVDVGAGIGLFTVRLARLTGAGGEVIAVEPDADAARQAIRNAALNDLSNVRVLHAAPGGSPAAGDGGPAAPGGSPAAGGGAQAAGFTVDAACPGPVALIRVGAPGCAAAVVAGAAATIGRHRPAVIFGCPPGPEPGPGAEPGSGAFGRLAAAGYLLYRIGSRGGRPAPRLVPLYGRPAGGGDVLAVGEHAAPRIISLVAPRDGRS